jgi:hypothetical protein
MRPCHPSLRRRGAAMATIASLMLALSACGGGTDAASPAPAPSEGATPRTVASAHAHTGAIPPRRHLRQRPRQHRPLHRRRRPLRHRPPHQRPAPAPASSLDQAKAVLANLDALRATALPVSGALATQNLDGCYLHNGESKAYITGLIDGDLTTYQQSQAYEVGSVRSNVRVIAERDVTNADTSTRKEVDVRYDITYKDGTSDIDAFQTMVTGSTSGLCATSSNSTTMRLVGNQRKVLVTLQARNIDTSIASLATGADVSESVRRETSVHCSRPCQSGHLRGRDRARPRCG